MTDKKKSDSGMMVMVIIAIIAVIIFIWLMMRKEPTDDNGEPPEPWECQPGTETYMFLEWYEPNPELINLHWFDHISQANASGLIPKDPAIFIPHVTSMLNQGKILPLQRDCAMLQYDELMQS